MLPLQANHTCSLCSFLFPNCTAKYEDPFPPKEGWNYILVFSKYISTRISIKKRKLFSKTRTPDRNVLWITSRVRTHEAVSERTRPRFIRTVSRCSCGRSFAFSTLPRFLLQANISSYSLLFCLARPAWPAQPARLFCLDCPLKVDYATTVLL